MHSGVAITIYLSIFAFITILFILVTRYYNYRVNKAWRENSIYPLIDQNSIEEEEIDEQEYKKILENMGFGKEKKQGKPSKRGLFQQMNLTEQNIFNGSALTLPSSSRRFGASTKSERLNIPNTFSSKSGKYQFVTQAVAYNEEGLLIMKNDIQEIWKESSTGEINTKNSYRKFLLNKRQPDFLKTLESYGFEERIYGAYKFLVTVQIPHMQVGKIYKMDNLKQREQKVDIEVHDFYQLVVYEN